MEINAAVDYVNNLGNKFDFTQLNDNHYRTFFIIRTRNLNSLNINDVRFRNLAAVIAEFGDSLREMQLDIVRLLMTECRGLDLGEDLTLSVLLDALSKIDLYSTENFYGFLEDLTNTSYATLVTSKNINEYQTLLMQAVLFISLFTLKHLAGIADSSENRKLTEMLKGVEVGFERARKRA